jgi:hypothetical protein
VRPLVWVGAAVGALALLCCGLGAVSSMLDGDKPADPPRQVAAAPTDPTPTATSALPSPTAQVVPPSTTPPSATGQPSPSAVYYANCDAARAAGAAPIRRGQPGYRPPLDRDNDGVACEQSEGSTGGGSTGGGSTGGGSNGGGTDPRFGTCKAAKAAGYGPYVRGRDAEYDWYRDADNDGTVCE